MSHSNAFETYPAVRAIVLDGHAAGVQFSHVLADLEAHARRHQVALRFQDAIEMARQWEALDEGRPAGPRTYKSGEKVPASGIYATDHVRQAGQRYVAGGRQATLTRGERFPPSPFTWSLVQQARHVT